MKFAPLQRPGWLERAHRRGQLEGQVEASVSNPPTVERLQDLERELERMKDAHRKEGRYRGEDIAHLEGYVSALRERVQPKGGPSRAGLVVAAGVGSLALAGLVAAIVWRRGTKPRDPEKPGPRPPTPQAKAPAPVALVWTGPVSREQVRGAELAGVGVEGVELGVGSDLQLERGVPGWLLTSQASVDNDNLDVLVVEPGEVGGAPVIVKGCTGDGSPSCGQIAESFRDREGRRVPTMRGRLGIPPGRFALAGFSAGGHLIWRVLQDERDRGDVAVVYLADATYTTEWRDKARRLAAPIPAFVLFARDVMDDPSRLFVATASSAPNKNHPTGAETLAAIAAELALPEVNPDTVLPPDIPKPVRAWAKGSVLFLDYGAMYGHGEHATKLAPVLWPAVVAPHFQEAA